MFNGVERQVILENLIDMFKSREDISAVILVGSALKVIVWEQGF